MEKNRIITKNRDRSLARQVIIQVLEEEVGTEVFISEGVASAPTVYSFLKNETKVFFTFVPRSNEEQHSYFYLNKSKRTTMGKMMV